MRRRNINSYIAILAITIVGAGATMLIMKTAETADSWAVETIEDREFD